MRIVVQKYGGSSVADLSKLHRVAERVAQTRNAGFSVVVVVSAMGNTTDELIALAHRVTDQPDRRELDMLISVGERISMALLAMALRDRGVAARSFTGSQSGIVTDESHADANIVEVRPHRIQRALEAGQVAIVAGFQGVSREREVTTLGRGGSDTTAVALAAALGAEHCEICSDVDGVWSADPRQVPTAHKLDALSLDDALALARGGAKVLFEDAVRLARDAGITLRTASTFGSGSGTTLDAQAAASASRAVTGSLGLIGLTMGSDPQELVRYLNATGVRIRRRLGDVLHVDTANAHSVLADLPGGAKVLGPVSVVTAVGSSLGESLPSLIAADESLEHAGIKVLQSHSSGDSAWWQVAEDDLADAVRVLHDALGSHEDAQ